MKFSRLYLGRQRFDYRIKLRGLLETTWAKRRDARNLVQVTQGGKKRCSIWFNPLLMRDLYIISPSGRRPSSHGLSGQLMVGKSIRKRRERSASAGSAAAQPRNRLPLPPGSGAAGKSSQGFPEVAVQATEAQPPQAARRREVKIPVKREFMPTGVAGARPGYSPKRERAGEMTGARRELGEFFRGGVKRKMSPILQQQRCGRSE